MDKCEWEQRTAEDLRRIAVSLTKLADLKDQASELIRTLASGPSENSPTNNGKIKNEPQRDEKPTGNANGNERKPLRPPRAETVRADIYAVMPSTPTQAKEIIEAVAARRGVAPKGRLAATIREVLRDRYDPNLEKTGYGMYRLVTGKQTGT